MQTQVQTTTHTRVATAVGVMLITLGVVAFAAAGAAALAAPAKLGILATAVTTTPITVGAQDVPVLGLTVAAQHKDVEVTQLAFHVLADNDGSFATIENDVAADNHIRHCSLVTTRGVTLAGPSPVDPSGVLEFSLQATVPSGKKVEAEIRCSFTTTTPESGTSDIYAWTILDTGDVEARTRNNTALTGNQIVLETPGGTSLNTQGAIAITMLGTGTLSAGLASDSPEGGILIQSSLRNPVATYRFSATNEPMVIEKLHFTTIGEASGIANVTLSYTNQAGATIQTSAPLTNGELIFHGLSAYVSPTAPANIQVSADITYFQQSRTDSGDTVTFSLDGDNEFSAYGTISGETIQNFGSDISAHTFTFRGTKPTLSLAAGSPTGAAIPSMSEVLRFNVASDSSDDVEFHQVTFEVSSTTQNPGWNQCGGAADLGNAAKWDMYEIHDPATKLDDNGDWSFREADGSTCEPGDTLAYAVLNFRADTATSSETIGAGDTTTYVLRVNTTGAGIDDTFQIKIPEESTVPSVSSFVWGDGISQTPIDGTGLKNLPVIGGQLHY